MSKTDIVVGIFFILFVVIALWLGTISNNRKLERCEKINHRQCDLNELRNY